MTTTIEQKHTDPPAGTVNVDSMQRMDDILKQTDAMRIVDARFIAETVQRHAYVASLADRLDGGDAHVVIQPLIDEVLASMRRFLDAVNSMVVTTAQRDWLEAYVDAAPGMIGDDLGMALGALCVDDSIDDLERMIAKREALVT
jgi:hypothetical protein